MRKRLDLGKDGLLRERNGTVVGSLVSLTLELNAEEPLGGVGGVKEVQHQQQTLAVGSSDVSDNSNVGGSRGEVLAREEIAEHYRQTFPKKRFALNGKQAKVIDDALKVRSVNDCKRAITGLAADEFLVKGGFTEIRYALASKGAQSVEERIDAMGAKVGSTETLLAGIPSAGHEMVRRRQNQVEQMLLHPESTHLQTRGVPSQSFLREQFGLSANLVDGQVVWHRATGDAA